ncbi:hypothetical protein P0D87_19135 [Paraburkholderia sp. RL17-368-BIF-A]|jgi:hypothetical protein|uniref:hypothetical protein n=1 Tax=Paraburkholderia TaxID=1822464 RepID=UPI0006B3EF06|nr:hypothetical protein [Paraburkholderia graminis]ALE58899.1 hypothetical protein AC233_30880 [Burkholderia sp. HB1]MDR6468710.1 hypothetical protein [Paraburkholderia graminis]
MSLNKDDAIIKSFIDAAQQDLHSAFGDIEARTLQACDSCSSAQECSDKINAIASATSNVLETLTDKIQSRSTAISDKNSNYVNVLMVLTDVIVDNNAKTMPALMVALIDYASEILGTDGIEGAEIFPDRLKEVLDGSFVPFYANSALFFGWLELQPTPVFVS